MWVLFLCSETFLIGCCTSPSVVEVLLEVLQSSLWVNHVFVNLDGSLGMGLVHYIGRAELCEGCSLAWGGDITAVLDWVLSAATAELWGDAGYCHG